MPKAKRPKRGTHLDFEGLRSETARVIEEDGRTLREIAEAVVSADPERETLSRAAISYAKSTAEGGAVNLQTAIIATLTGATITGPFFRVD